MLFTAAIGLFIARIGEQRALTIEYIGLIISFVGYAFVEPEKTRSHIMCYQPPAFAMTIVLKTYLQKVADKKDITVVIISTLLGLLWLY
ncbi:MAG: hypothetical protein ACJAYB_002794 [Psychromonas sp.]